MIRTYSQMHRTDMYSQHSSIIWSVWLNGWVFVSELSGCGFESRCSHLNNIYNDLIITTTVVQTDSESVTTITKEQQ